MRMEGYIYVVVFLVQNLNLIIQDGIRGGEYGRDTRVFA